MGWGALRGGEGVAEAGGSRNSGGGECGCGETNEGEDWSYLLLKW